jgi:hypothetical protein
MASELKTIDSMPGSINELISQNYRLKRPPSLSESFAWTPENVERANRVPLISSHEQIFTEDFTEELKEDSMAPKLYKYEQQIIEISLKLLIHITLISIFETLFYFFYVSSLENNGIEKTVNTFINGAANGCSNMTAAEIQFINYILGPLINSSQIIAKGNNKEVIRALNNNQLTNQSWYYVGGLLGISLFVIIYVKLRKIQIKWNYILFENISMVLLLGLYELMFFDTIIYDYEPISTDEIARNAIEKLQNTCGILKITTY